MPIQVVGDFLDESTITIWAACVVWCGTTPDGIFYGNALVFTDPPLAFAGSDACMGHSDVTVTLESKSLGEARLDEVR